VDKLARTFVAGRGVWRTLEVGSLLVAMAGLYGWFQDALSWTHAALAVALVLGCFVWAKTLRLDLTENGVRYRSAVFSRSLAWTDVGVVGLRWKDGPGYGGIESDARPQSTFRFESCTPGRRSIEFHPAYFSKRDCQAMERIAATYLSAARKKSSPP
jgi:hypothetical protein